MFNCWMCVYIHIFIYIYMSVYIFIFVYIFMFVYIFRFVYIYIVVNIYMFVYIFMFVYNLTVYLPFCRAVLIFSSDISPRLFALCALWFELVRTFAATVVAGLVITIWRLGRTSDLYKKCVNEKKLTLVLIFV